MDGISLYCICNEIEKNSSSHKIEKIHQPEKDTVVITFRGNKKLVICTSANGPRMYYSEKKFENPMTAPMLCMLMRKHLIGAELVKVEQLGLDRVVFLHFIARNDFGDKVPMQIVVEFMGKHSNMIIVKDDGTILDSMLRVSPVMSSVRSVLPGLKFVLPPGQNKLNPMTMTEADFSEILKNKDGISSIIFENISGISPQCSEEIALIARKKAVENNENFSDNSYKYAYIFFCDLKAGKICPTIVSDGKKPIGYFAFDPLSYSDSSKSHFETVSEMLDAFYGMKEKSAAFTQARNLLVRATNSAIQKCRKKLDMQQDILYSKDKITQNKLVGDLVSANAHMIKKGMKSIQLVNYYDDNKTVEVLLDERRKPHENAQLYYKRYNKMKTAFDLAFAQVSELTRELEYLESIIDDIQKCSNLQELSEIKDELSKGKYIRSQQQNKGRKKGKTHASTPMKFLSPSEREIWVGKNNTQNDKMTMREAKPDETWLHAKDIPGSHVLVRGDEALDDETLKTAAMLAAYYSKARNSSNVQVDYVKRRYIKKPNGSSAGFVIYTNSTSVFITPDSEYVEKLKRIDD